LSDSPGPRVESTEACLLVWIRCACSVAWATTWPVGTRTDTTLDEINALAKDAPRIAVFKTPVHGEPLCVHGGVNVIVGSCPRKTDQR